jgi:hypothetical protein
MWQQIETDRWTWTADQDRHLLLRHDGVYVELHGNTLHRYVGGEGIHLTPAPDGDGLHLADVRWTHSAVAPELADITDADVWRRMSYAVSVDAPDWELPAYDPATIVTEPTGLPVDPSWQEGADQFAAMQAQTVEDARARLTQQD